MNASRVCSTRNDACACACVLFLRVLLCVAQTNSREFKRKKEREFFLFIIRAKFQRVFPTAVKRDLFLLLWSINNGNQREKKGKRKGKGDEIFCHTKKCRKKNVLAN